MSTITNDLTLENATKALTLIATSQCPCTVCVNAARQLLGIEEIEPSSVEKNVSHDFQIGDKVECVSLQPAPGVKGQIVGINLANNSPFQVFWPIKNKATWKMGKNIKKIDTEFKVGSTFLDKPENLQLASKSNSDSKLEFKIGDKVTIIKMNSPGDGKFLGLTGVVDSFTDPYGGYVIIKLDPNYLNYEYKLYVLSSEITLTEELTDSKSDLVQELASAGNSENTVEQVGQKLKSIVNTDPDSCEKIFGKDFNSLKKLGESVVAANNSIQVFGETNLAIEYGEFTENLDGFKIGDKVLIKDVLIKNKIGTVVELLHYSTYPIRVKWDNSAVCCNYKSNELAHWNK